MCGFSVLLHFYIIFGFGVSVRQNKECNNEQWDSLTPIHVFACPCNHSGHCGCGLGGVGVLRTETNNLAHYKSLLDLMCMSVDSDDMM